MSDDEKLLWMFEQVHGFKGTSGQCYTELEYDDYLNAIAVNVMKDNNLCWTATKLDLVFDYLTKHL